VIQCENVVSLTVKMEVVKPVMPWWMKNNRIGTVRKPVKIFVPGDVVVFGLVCCISSEYGEGFCCNTPLLH